MRPDVSLLMTIYNGLENYPPDTLFTALITTLSEKGPAIEVCIVDDASTDGTWEYLNYWGDDCLRIKRHSANRGAAAGYRTAAGMARGRYCILQSARSWYEPGALKAMVEALDANPGVGFVYGQTQYHGARETLYRPPPFDRERFFVHFDSLFGYMYRRRALDAGCRYVSYFEREGRQIDICDYDFVMQLIVNMGWDGLALRDRLCLHYLYSGQGQMTELVHRYQRQIDAVFNERWGAARCV